MMIGEVCLLISDVRKLADFYNTAETFDESLVTYSVPLCLV